ncbi:MULTISPECIES: hypothetical protein [unclassified Halomonas]|uniref:hypothetical protein n=1 Tax=unclassified Halomonas TaxID=2609666 RepID=UPI003F90DA62
MNERQQLEKLRALRESRLRRAEYALAEQRRRCQTDAENLETLDTTLAEQRRAFDRQEEAWFNSSGESVLSKTAFEDMRQGINVHYRRQAVLEETRLEAEQEQSRQLTERDRLAAEWVRRMRSERALGKLVARRHDAERFRDEAHAELEAEDAGPRGVR